MKNGESERRRGLVASGQTDIARWSNPQSLEPAWGARAQLAAAYVPAGARVLDLGCGGMDLERFLPDGCTYQPCDLVARDARTIVCDFNKGEFPADIACDVASALGVLEYLFDAPAFLAKLRALGCPIILSYSLAQPDPTAERGSGWANHFTESELLALVTAAGFARYEGKTIEGGQILLRLDPDAADQPIANADRADASKGKRVLVLSYYNMANFGDRLGYHVLNNVLPPDALVTYGTIRPWNVPDREYDLLILGIGNSLIANDACLPELAELIGRIPHAIGIFGTQFREQFAQPSAARALDTLLGRLTTWWARYEDDLRAFGQGRANARHLGDWLISAFPMAEPTSDKGLTIPAEIIREEKPLDRMIQKIQSYRAVSSARLHTLLCALTSADHVAYQEQRIEGGGDAVSGKFGSLLVDVFGRTFPEDALFAVDRAAVVDYKRKVAANMAALRAELADLLA